MKVYVEFSKSKVKFPLFAWLIALWTRSWITHVNIKWYSNSISRWLRYQASKSFLHFIGEAQFIAQHEVLECYEIEIDDEWFYELVQYCVDTAGAKYGFWEIIGLVIADIFKLKKNPFGDGQNHTSAQFCSELVSYIIDQYLLKEVSGKDYALMSPKELRDAVSKITKFKLVK